MWELGHKEGWAPKIWCFWIVVLEKTLESPLDCKEIKLVHPKGDQSWRFTERTDAEAEVPILWPPAAKSQLIRKDPDAGKHWRHEETGMKEDERAGWHHWLNGLEFEQALGVGDRQGSLVCCSPWGHQESDMTERLNNNNHKSICYCCLVTKLCPTLLRPHRASLVSQLVKNPSAMQETPVQFLSWEDTLEKG